MKRQVINVEGIKKNPHLSRGVRFGDLLFTSAMPGKNQRTGQFPGSDMGSQTRQALENVKDVVEAAGGSLKNVLKMTCYLVDMSQRAAFDAVYEEYFPEDPPARFCLILADRGTGNLIEIEAIAGLEQ